MARRSTENIGGLLVLSQLALHMGQTTFSEFLRVSDRTMRRWVNGGAQLYPPTLLLLARAVYAKDPALAARLVAAHGQTLEELGIGLTGDLATRYAMASAAGALVGVSPHAMRPALGAALETARAAGLTMEAACALFAVPARAE